MAPFLDPQPRFESRQEPGQMRVGKDAEIALNGRTGHARIPREPRHGKHLAMKNRRHREKPGEAGKIADERLGLDLFLEIHLPIGLEGLAPVGCGPDHREAPVAEHLGEIKIGPQLPRQERKHLPVERPAGEEIRAGLLQLAGTRPEEDKPHLSVLDEAVHFIEQPRNPLDLIDDDGRPTGKRAQFVGKKARLAEERLIEPLVEQIDPVGVRKHAPRPGAFSRATHAKQKKTPLPRRHENAIIWPLINHVVIYTGKMTARLRDPEFGMKPERMRREPCLASLAVEKTIHAPWTEDGPLGRQVEGLPSKETVGVSCGRPGGKRSGRTLPMDSRGACGGRIGLPPAAHPSGSSRSC